MPRRTKPKFKVGDIVVWESQEHSHEYNGSLAYITGVKYNDQGICSVSVRWISVTPEMTNSGHDIKWLEEGWIPGVFHKIGEVDAEEV